MNNMAEIQPGQERYPEADGQTDGQTDKLKPISIRYTGDD